MTVLGMKSGSFLTYFTNVLLQLINGFYVERDELTLVYSYLTMHVYEKKDKTNS